MELLNFGANIIKKGTKTQNESYAEIKTVSTIGNFKLNNKALAQLGVIAGEGRVIFIDMYPQAEAQDQRYFVANGDGIDGSVSVGKTRLVSHSSIYNTILLGDPTSQSVTRAGLKEADKLHADNIAAETVAFELVPYNNGEPVQIGEVEAVVFALTNPIVTERTEEEE